MILSGPFWGMAQLMRGAHCTASMVPVARMEILSQALFQNSHAPNSSFSYFSCNPIGPESPLTPPCPVTNWRVFVSQSTTATLKHTIAVPRIPNVTMRLINVNTMELEEFFDQEIPPYAILSHRWEKDEVTFQLYATSESRQKKAGYGKIKGFCRVVREDGIHYAWVDTCCIDKTSSSELSEAINSMFAWYRGSIACYAYLSDVAPAATYDSDPYDRPLRESNWFTRGWTLQELLAPVHLTFYDKNWQSIGTRSQRSRIVQEITGIGAYYLSEQSDPVTEAKVAEKFSWASQRKTTRTEDMAYCLLGLLDVNMPLLYGEGHKAFRRLQEEFMRTHLDLSLLTWGYMDPPHIYMGFTNDISRGVGCLANTVSQFQRWNGKTMSLKNPEEHHTTTNAGLLLTARAQKVGRIGDVLLGFIPLDNIRDLLQDTFLVIPLVWNANEGGPTKAQRADGNGPFWMPRQKNRPAVIDGRSSIDGRTYLVSPPQIQVNPPPDLLETITSRRYHVHYDAGQRQCELDVDHLSKHGYRVADFYPPAAFRRPGALELVRVLPLDYALLRFSHPVKRDIFLLQWHYPSTSGGPTLSLGIAPKACTTWEHLLKPDYDRISFQRPIKSFTWFSNVRLGDLKRGSRIFIDVQEGFDLLADSYIPTHVNLRVSEACLPVDSSYDSDQSDNWSISAERG